MKSILFYVPLFFLLITSSLFCESDFIKTENNVDLVEEPILDKFDELQGKQYFVFNRNRFPVYVQLKLTNGVNVFNYLMQPPQFVGAEQVESFGQVLIENRTIPYEWSVDWTVNRQQF